MQMIKVKNTRYNPMEFRKYYPFTNPGGEHCIAIEWNDPTQRDSIIPFDNERERNAELDAWDEVLLIVKDGKVVVREMPVDFPFIVEGGGGPTGGINLQ